MTWHEGVTTKTITTFCCKLSSFHIATYSLTQSGLIVVWLYLCYLICSPLLAGPQHTVLSFPFLVPEVFTTARSNIVDRLWASRLELASDNIATRLPTGLCNASCKFLGFIQWLCWGNFTLEQYGRDMPYSTAVPLPDFTWKAHLSSQCSALCWGC